mmetsp:Transcript_3242/g.10942  ORF Transcript_3242/g.10942 Transcript_3242/m.10942 type:complete len:255 (-) Transcript_3242:998-1762(-)
MRWASSSASFMRVSASITACCARISASCFALSAASARRRIASFWASNSLCLARICISASCFNRCTSACACTSICLAFVSISAALARASASTSNFRWRIWCSSSAFSCSMRWRAFSISCCCSCSCSCICCCCCCICNSWCIVAWPCMISLLLASARRRSSSSFKRCFSCSAWVIRFSPFAAICERRPNISFLMADTPASSELDADFCASSTCNDVISSRSALTSDFELETGCEDCSIRARSSLISRCIAVIVSSR